jgi:tetratricopeptide (TPR) repeat protein
MQVRLRLAAVAVGTLLIAGSAVSAHAQDKKEKGDTVVINPCDPNAVVTSALVKSTLVLQRAFQTANAKGDPTTDLKLAIGYLTAPPPKKETGDTLGRAFYLAQAYLMLLQQPGVAPIGQRKNYGIATDSLMTIDLLAAADSALTKVQQGWPPVCSPALAQWRQQKPWIDALNGSINALNAGKYDSAEALAKRSLIIERSAPYAYTVLASVANARKEYDEASAYQKKGLELALKDTMYNDAKLNIIYDMANTATLRAESAPAADKRARVDEAVAAWQTFMPIGSRDAQVASAQQSIVRLLKSIGDSTNLALSYAPMLANPEKYGEQSLISAGYIATRARKPVDAIKFFTTVLAQNPNSRDALNNLAASYVSTNEQQKMFPLIDRLVSVDPNMPENWQLYAYAYSGLLKGTKDPKLVKAYTDSLVKYNTKSEKLPTRVTLSEFSHLNDKATIAGTIENRALTPKSYTFEVDFLDKSGTVVATQSASVGPVPGKGGTTQFSVSADAKDVVAFRYKPLP